MTAQKVDKSQQVTAPKDPAEQAVLDDIKRDADLWSAYRLDARGAEQEDDRPEPIAPAIFGVSPPWLTESSPIHAIGLFAVSQIRNRTGMLVPRYPMLISWVVSCSVPTEPA